MSRYFKKLVGDRIYLSPRTPEDAEKFTEWMNDFYITDYIGYSGQLMSLEGEKKFLNDNNNPEAIFSIIDMNKDEIIGTVGLDKIDYKNSFGVLGIFIGNKDYWNNGYGTEAIRLLLDYSFNYLNLHSVRLDVCSFNERAINCYRKCGFKEAGRIRENKFINGKYYDTVMMDVLRSEFEGEFIRNKNIR